MCSGEVWATLLEKGRECLPGVRRAHSRRELDVLDFRCLLELLPLSALHESLARLQCSRGLLGQGPRGLTRRGQQCLIGHNLCDESERRCPRGIEWLSQKD